MYFPQFSYKLDGLKCHSCSFIATGIETSVPNSKNKIELGKFSLLVCLDLQFFKHQRNNVSRYECFMDPVTFLTKEI